LAPTRVSLALNPGYAIRAISATGHEGATMSYGPNPWQQTSWDARAAGNYICGGAGAGLILFTALSGARGPALTGLMLAGLALVAFGLFCVFLETGRPLRAINVLFNPRTSWMSREAITATLLFATGLSVAAGATQLVWVAAALALVFVYCQARMLQAAKGIPAWREPLLVPLIVATGLTEGAGLFLLALPFTGIASPSLPIIVFGLLVIARMLVWRAYRRRVSGALARGAVTALDRAGQALRVAGLAVPLALVAVILAGLVSGGPAAVLAAVAGAGAAFAGAYAKFTLVTRAGFNQGFVLAHLPVRGQPR
jgi:phenylacetyl-CoA:acceptor oxidoreductase subunit 2